MITTQQVRIISRSAPKTDDACCRIIVPNHIHAIFILEEAAGVNPCPTITDIVCAYKSLTTRQCKLVRPIDKLFQTLFYEHVIRGREDYTEIAEYIINNPKQWELDNLYSKE